MYELFFVYRSEYKLGNRILLNVIATGISASQNRHAPQQQYVTRKKEVAYRNKKAELFCIFGGENRIQGRGMKRSLASRKFFEKDRVFLFLEGSSNCIILENYLLNQSKKRRESVSQIISS